AREQGARFARPEPIARHAPGCRLRGSREPDLSALAHPVKPRERLAKLAESAARGVARIEAPHEARGEIVGEAVALPLLGARVVQIPHAIEQALVDPARTPGLGRAGEPREEDELVHLRL